MQINILVLYFKNKVSQTDKLGLSVGTTCDLICLTLLFECCFAVNEYLRLGTLVSRTNGACLIGIMNVVLLVC